MKEVLASGNVEMNITFNHSMWERKTNRTQKRNRKQKKRYISFWKVENDRNRNKSLLLISLKTTMKLNIHINFLIKTWNICKNPKLFFLELVFYAVLSLNYK